jgi:crotonobetainyl-CoA:carnitine CoA-transferase CaiB-like acyl-CoA transferase
MTIAPYDTFDAADGVLVLAVGNDTQWQRLCDALGLDALGAEARFSTNAGRVVEYDALHASLAAVFRQHALGPLVDRLRAAGVPCGAVRSVDEAMADPQIAARAMIEAIDHPTIGRLSLLGVPVKLSMTPGAVRTPPPRLGEHTAAVLRQDLGMDEAAVRALAEKRVVRLLE